MKVSLRQLRYLLAVAENGQISRAAEAVHISQPALSVQIRELETTLGVTLLERLPRRVVLTPAGHEIVDHARRVLAELDALERTARMTRGLGGRLSLGVIPTVAPYLIPAALPLMRAENLSLDLRVREATTDVLLADLEQGRLDAIVVALPSGAAEVEEQELFADRFLLAGSGGRIASLLGEGKVPHPSELKPSQLLLLDEGHCLADQALDACAFDRRDTRVDLGASSLSTLSGLVAGGFGLTFIPEIAAAKEMSAVPELRLLRFPPPEPRRTIGLVRRASSPGREWFEDLGSILRTAGKALIDRAVPALQGTKPQPSPRARDTRDNGAETG